MSDAADSLALLRPDRRGNPRIDCLRNAHATCGSLCCS
jgi:hypothetical protein